MRRSFHGASVSSYHGFVQSIRNGLCLGLSGPGLSWGLGFGAYRAKTAGLKALGLDLRLCLGMHVKHSEPA